MMSSKIWDHLQHACFNTRICCFAGKWLIPRVAFQGQHPSILALGTQHWTCQATEQSLLLTSLETSSNSRKKQRKLLFMMGGAPWLPCPTPCAAVPSQRAISAWSPRATEPGGSIRGSSLPKLIRPGQILWKPGRNPFLLLALLLPTGRSTGSSEQPSSSNSSSKKRRKRRRGWRGRMRKKGKRRSCHPSTSVQKPLVPVP